MISNSENIKINDNVLSKKKKNKVKLKFIKKKNY
jgi:hypothetical protein